MRAHQITRHLARAEKCGMNLERMGATGAVDENGIIHVACQEGKKFCPQYKKENFKRFTLKQLLEQPDSICPRCFSYGGSQKRKIQAVASAVNLLERIQAKAQQLKREGMAFENYAELLGLYLSLEDACFGKFENPNGLKEWFSLIQKDLTKARKQLVKDNIKALEPILIENYAQRYRFTVNLTKKRKRPLWEDRKSGLSAKLEAFHKEESVAVGLKILDTYSLPIESLVLDLYVNNEKTSLIQVPFFFSDLVRKSVKLKKPLTKEELETAGRLYDDGGIYDNIQKAVDAARAV